MAKTGMRCACGWLLYVEEPAPDWVRCPACGDAISTSFESCAPADPEAPQAPAKSSINPIIVIAAGLVAGLLIALLVLIINRTPRAPERIAELPQPTAPAPAPDPAPAPVPIARAPEPPAPVPEPSPLSPSDPERAVLARNAARANLIGLVASTLLNAGHAAEHSELAGQVRWIDRDIEASIRRLADRNVRAEPPVRFEAGDRIVAFAGYTLDPKQPFFFAQALKTRLGALKPGATEMCSVQRGTAKVSFLMSFPDNSPDIEALARRTDRVPPFVPTAEAEAPLPAELLSAVRKAFEGLHPHYRGRFPSGDAERMNRLLRTGRGLAADADFLRTRVLVELCARFAEDYAGLQTRLKETEAKSIGLSVPDVVLFKDGRRLEGTIEEETAEEIRIKMKFGAARVARVEIAEIRRGKERGGDFPARYAEARGNVEKLAALLAWCREKSLADQKTLVGYAILVIDPGHSAAWAELGYGAETAAGPAAQDAVFLRDGTVRSGLLVAETEDSITLDVVLRGPKGEISGMGRVVVDKDDVARVERISEEARRKSREQAASFQDRSARREEALAEIALYPAELRGRKGFASVGAHFRIESSCDERFAREATWALEQVFEAYKQHFGVRRNRERKVTVYLFADRAEYDEYLVSRFGGRFLNPAFYHPEENFIAAYNLIETREAEVVRKAVAAAQKSIEAHKKRLSDVQREAERHLKELREQNSKVPGFAEALKESERRFRSRLASARREANAAIEHNLSIISRNNRILEAQNRAMFETLFHEGFHAFAANYLWEDRNAKGLPLWLHEGMATYFEMSVVEPGGLVHGGYQPGLLQVLRANLKSGTSVPLASLLRAGHESFTVAHRGQARSSAAHYAQSWAVAHWLAGRGRREEIEKYVTAVVEGADPAEALARVTGKTLATIEAEVRLHLDTLR